MTTHRLTDGQLKAALRVTLPAAPAGLRSEIQVAVERTPQLSALPGLLGAFTDADPMARRRVILLAAAALLALTALLAIAAGALLDSQRLPSDLVILPSASTPSTPRPSAAAGRPADQIVLDAYTGLADAPAFRLEFREENGDVAEVWSYNGAGVLRRDRASPNPPEISTSGGLGRHPLSELAWALGFHEGLDGWACETGWKALGEVELLSRVTDWVRCVTPADMELTRELWIDRETGIPLRSSRQDGNLFPVVLEAAAIEVGPQPPALFESAEGATRPPSSEPTRGPVVEPLPAPDQGGVPGDVSALVDHVLAGYRQRALDITLAPTPVGLDTYRWLTNGNGAFRMQRYSPTPLNGIVLLWAADGRIYESYPQPDGSVKWRLIGPVGPGEQPMFPAFGLRSWCSVGWRHLGVDLVLDRPADHIACAYQEFWIDREWLVVVRGHDRDPLLEPDAGVGWVTSVQFEAPAGLLEPPPPESLFEPYPTPGGSGSVGRGPASLLGQAPQL